MKRVVIVLVVVAVIAAGCAFLLATTKTILPPSVLVELMLPNIARILVTDEAWRQSIEEDPTAHEYSGYGVLQRRRSDVAIREGLRDLRSDDAYVWANAAAYLGSLDHPDSVPYLIKGLRHTASQSDDERAAFLERITGQSIGKDFAKWRAWYEDQPDRIEMDWTSSLGSRPRTPIEYPVKRAVETPGV